MQFSSIFAKDLVASIVKEVKKDLLSGGFLEEIKAIGVEKMHQIRTEIDKNTKNIKFWKLLCSF